MVTRFVAASTVVAVAKPIDPAFKTLITISSPTPQLGLDSMKLQPLGFR